MSASRRWWLFVALLLIGSCGLALWVAPDSNKGFKDAAAVIAFSTMLAVGIERTFEIGWTLVDQSGRLGAYWPMSLISPHLAEIESQTNKMLDPIFKSAKDALTEARDTAEAGSDEFVGLQGALTELETTRDTAQKRFAIARSLAPGSPRIANVAAVADTMAKQLQSAFDGAGHAFGSGRTTLDLARLRAQDALDIIGTFGDNPARRLSSLLLGAAAGAMIAGFVGVNLFAAIVDGGPPLLSGKLGIVVTGLVAGLGSGPTHELVKSLQASKNARQVQVVGVGSDESHHQAFLRGGGGAMAGAGVAPVVIRSTD